MTVPSPITPWPPIIRNAARPRAILWRDWVCTTVMWLLLLWLCRSALHRLWAASWKLLQGEPLEFSAAVTQWAYLRHHFTLIWLLAVWLSVWTIITLWRRQRYLNRPQPAPLTLQEEAKKIIGAPTDLSAWRKLKICVAYLDSEGNVSVLPKKDD